MSNLYHGTKLVRAEPMNRLAYNELRGWQLPSDENPSDEGYLVEYLDGGAPNVEGYEGYVSWSPKAVFDNAYTLIREVKATDPDYVVRMKVELADLQRKRISAEAFVFAEAELGREHPLLNRQIEVMGMYEAILIDRLKEEGA